MYHKTVLDLKAKIECTSFCVSHNAKIQPEQAVEQTTELPIIWCHLRDVIVLCFRITVTP